MAVLSLPSDGGERGKKESFEVGWIIHCIIFLPLANSLECPQFKGRCPEAVTEMRKCRGQWAQVQWERSSVLIHEWLFIKYQVHLLDTWSPSPTTVRWRNTSFTIHKLSLIGLLNCIVKVSPKIHPVSSSHSLRGWGQLEEWVPVLRGLYSQTNFISVSCLHRCLLQSGPSLLRTIAKVIYLLAQNQTSFSAHFVLIDPVHVMPLVHIVMTTANYKFRDVWGSAEAERGRTRGDVDQWRRK